MRGDWDLESEYDNILYLTKADLIESNFSLLIYYDYKSKQQGKRTMDNLLIYMKSVYIFQAVKLVESW